MSNRDLILSYFKSFSSGEPEVVARHVTDDFVNEHLGVLGGGCETKAVYTQRLSNFLSMFQQLRYEVLDICVDGNSASGRYQMHFLQDGQRFEVPGIMWFTLKDDLIAQRTDCWDGLTYLKQAGADAAAIAAMI